MLYNNLSGYLRTKYGKRLKKICIDGGFSCPNRDGKCGTGGCIFCGERGAGEHIDPTPDIHEQAERAIKSAKQDEEFIIYFQNFTNTYADPKTLKERYDAALISDRIRVLSIGTRPDCIDEEIAELIESYKSRCEVWVELGLQTSDDETAKRINRGYTLDCFERAVEILKRHEIPYVVHLIIGLPGETEDTVIRSAKYVARLAPFGVKIHSLYVMRGTRLEEEYLQKRYTPIGFKEYASLAARVVRTLPDTVVIHRLTGDCPRGLLVAPEWSADKNAVLAAIRRELGE